MILKSNYRCFNTESKVKPGFNPAFLLRSVFEGRGIGFGTCFMQQTPTYENCK